MNVQLKLLKTTRLNLTRYAKINIRVTANEIAMPEVKRRENQVRGGEMQIIQMMAVIYDEKE